MITSLRKILEVVAVACLAASHPAIAAVQADPLAPSELQLAGGKNIRVVKCYPDGRMRASCQGFDDGNLAADWPMFEALNKRKIPGTFFINSTNPSSKDAVGFPNRYAGHEIASHGANHKGLPGMRPEQVESEITTDQKILGEKFNQPIVGFAYPYGATYPEKDKQDALEAQLRSFGLIYARGTRSSNAYAPPADFISWNPDCGFMYPLDAFLKEPAEDRIRVRMVFVHGIDFAKGNYSYAKWEKMLDQLVADQSIWNVTYRDYARYVTALRALNVSPTGIRNDSELALWVKLNGVPRAIPAHANLTWRDLL